MNYAYEPRNQVQITEYNSYVTPVDEVGEIIKEDDPKLARSQLVFPDDEFTANCSFVDAPPGGPEVEQRVEQAFQDVVTGA
jgi:hypothetical protein